MKQLFLLLTLFISGLLTAQEDSKYLADAVPLENGKVVFKREFNPSSLDKTQIFQILLKWGKENFNTEKKRVAYQNEEKGEIALLGEDYLVFSSTALSLDRTLMKYRILIECEEHTCTLRLTSIYYEYNVSYQNEPEIYKAEEWITDKYALNKSKTKLNRVSGKFRKATINFAEKTFESVASALGERLLSETPTERPSEPTATITTSSTVPDGFVSLPSNKIPETILNMLPNDTPRLSVNEGNVTDKNITWKGVGDMFGKTICMIVISQDSPAYKTIENNGLYQVHFSKPEASPDEAWIIIECRKQGETSDNQKILLIGEITNVWIK